MAGANPTLTAITDENSRGGLFTQSNIANPVSGGSVSGSAANDSTITITLNFADGSPSQSQDFTVNQVMDETLTFTIPVGTGGMGTGTADGVVTGGGFDQGTGVLTLTRSNNLPDLTYSGFIFTPRTDTEINRLADGRIAASTTIVKSVNGITPSDNTGAITVPLGTPDLTNFESSNTVVFRQGTADSNDIAADARVRMQGNEGIGDNVGTSGANATEIVLAADTGLVLNHNTVTDVITIQAAGTPPQAPPTPVATTPPPTSAFSPSLPITTTVNLGDGSTLSNVDANGMTVAPVAATVTDPGGTQVPGVTVTGMDGDTSATVTIPAGSANPPGDYRFDVTTYVESTDGVIEEEMETTTASRPIPYFQSRTEPRTESDVTGGIAPAPVTAWSGSFTAIPGSGLLYLSVLDGPSGVANTVRFADQAMFPVRVSFVRPITVTLADGTTRVFNVFAMPGGAGQTISNFRTTR